MVVCFRGCSGCFWWSGCGNVVGALREEEEVAAEAAAGVEVEAEGSGAVDTGAVGVEAA